MDDKPKYADGGFISAELAERMRKCPISCNPARESTDEFEGSLAEAIGKALEDAKSKNLYIDWFYRPRMVR